MLFLGLSSINCLIIITDKWYVLTICFFIKPIQECKPLLLRHRSSLLLEVLFISVYFFPYRIYFPELVEKFGNHAQPCITRGDLSIK